MEQHSVEIKSLHQLTHDVIKVVTDKPQGYHFVAGQATELSIDKPGWQDEKRPFTFTSLPEDEHLEFTIKIYSSHKGVTNELINCRKNDRLILHEVFGTIGYKGEGIFIAGGAGVTPFISIIKQLQKAGQVGNNKLIFSNKTTADIILKDYFEQLLGDNFINILSEEKTPNYSFGYISKEFLSTYTGNKNQYFYICGPEPMMDAVEEQLKSLQVNTDCIIKEQF
jgi:ferredoxin-NADP reductase